MKKFRLRDYLPVLIMVLCAAIFGVLLATGVMDLNTVPQLVADRPVLAVLVVMGLYVLKGFSGVVVYNALVVVVSMVLPLPAALAVNGVGTAVCLSISYAMGRFTRTESLESVLDRHPKIKRYFSATQEYGFAMCFAIHMLGLNMEVLGLLLGMLRVDYLTYLAGSWLAIAPGMVCLVIAGNSLDLSSPVFWVFLAINTVLVVCSVVYTLRKLQGQRREAGRVEDDRLRMELLLSRMPEQVDYLHDAACWQALLSWMPEQVNYLHDAAYWRALLGRCQGAEVLQVREMESHEEFWADWLRQNNEYAIGDRKAMEAGGI